MRGLNIKTITQNNNISLKMSNNINKYKIRNNNNNNKNKNNNNDINKPRPTHFLGLKVQNINLETVANQLKQRHPRLSDSFTVKEKYHLSVVILTLDTEEKLNNAKLALNQIKEIYEKRYSSNNLLCKSQISGIGSFKERVLWAGLKSDHEDTVNLVGFVKEIRDLFKAQAFEIDDREWSPHITLAKSKFLNTMLSTPFTLSLNNNDFGQQDFNSMDLMKIGSTNKEDGYYEIIDTVKFN